MRFRGGSRCLAKGAPYLDRSARRGRLVIFPVVPAAGVRRPPSPRSRASPPLRTLYPEIGSDFIWVADQVTEMDTPTEPLRPRPLLRSTDWRITRSPLSCDGAASAREAKSGFDSDQTAAGRAFRSLQPTIRNIHGDMGERLCRLSASPWARRPRRLGERAYLFPAARCR